LKNNYCSGKSIINQVRIYLNADQESTANNTSNQPTRG